MTSKKQPKQSTLEAVKTFFKTRTPAQIIGAVLIIYLMFLSWQVAHNANRVDEIANQQEGVAYEAEGVILPTQGVAKPTATQIVIDPNKTPITLNADLFVYDDFEILFRGGSATAQCPYRWVSVRDQASIYGNVVGCLAPYSVWNIEKPYVNDGLNVWGCVAMQVEDRTCHKWIALKYAGVYFTNWHEQ